MNDDYIEAAIGYQVSVGYAPPDADPDLPYQVDGRLLAQTSPAIEGTFLVILEPTFEEDAEEEVCMRAIPIEWIVGMTIVPEEKSWDR